MSELCTYCASDDGHEPNGEACRRLRETEAYDQLREGGPLLALRYALDLFDTIREIDFIEEECRGPDFDALERRYGELRAAEGGGA